MTLVFSPKEHPFPAGFGLQSEAFRLRQLGMLTTGMIGALHVPLHLQRECHAAIPDTPAPSSLRASALEVPGTASMLVASVKVIVRDGSGRGSRSDSRRVHFRRVQSAAPSKTASPLVIPDSLYRNSLRLSACLAQMRAAVGTARCV